MIKNPTLLEYIMKEYLDPAIIELHKNNNYNLSKGSEISFVVYSRYLKKSTFKKVLPGTDYYKILINPSLKDMRLLNIFIAIFDRNSMIKMRKIEKITNNIFSRFHFKGKTEFI